ncbi:MAG: winged helix-turn-helix domain-containing protein [Nanoarchaeota archaeon]|nr:winged helix-turn-helix domain-containing protein [Nanoarchaeota archaeon]
METKEKILLFLIKENKQTATQLAEQLKISRQAVWKLLNKLIKEEIILAKQLSNKQKSVKIISLNFKSQLLKKNLSLILTKEAIENEKWIQNFAGLEKLTDFVLLFGSILTNPKQANDIDLLIMPKKKNFKEIEKEILEIQKVQLKKIHAIQLTNKEFYKEIKNQNKAYLDAIKKGVVLYGQDNFIKQMEKLNGN